MRTLTTTAATRSLAAALLLLTVSACGSETADPEEDGNGADTGFDVSGATLTEEPFCDRLDTSLVADLLELPADKVRTQVDREVGEKFSGSAEPQGPSKSVANLCVLGTGTSQFVVSVQPGATSSDVQETVDELAGLTGEASSETCSSGDAEEFGNPAAFFTCESEPPIERVRVVATGLVDESKFYCAAILNQGGGPELAESTRAACDTVLQELASEG